MFAWSTHEEFSETEQCSNSFSNRYGYQQNVWCILFFLIPRPCWHCASSVLNVISNFQRFELGRVVIILPRNENWLDLSEVKIESYCSLKISETKLVPVWSGGKPRQAATLDSSWHLKKPWVRKGGNEEKLFSFTWIAFVPYGRGIICLPG